uniref:Chromosome 5 open reading frame 34 n=2 Tax=Podarcis muralis TaxID=64176 RepID=A0A670JSI9_PODMU|nr:uncharacterized protein C5orf34 homolog isoform X1 [Podarcis muralis]XP_028605166.1 uncharacterized protein C5orf34 homolog isoform X1 [Podarcis muralis]XP_028605167.1 uncharacterized protein C5orf34 homolog isoform X1 [Podarcis muralis]XP_028605168.1 uncharacterized protein C5orf34 homolog isoform X1 [Podarcis muralis]XP_028605169.1 uncharacterized protein C5orf34 homolog isoform X1 [Podarcis muralis]
MYSCSVKGLRLSLNEHHSSAAMESESIMILYEDNSVEVHYVDGSRLLLSPCGSEFLFEKAVPASAHPIQPAERIRQRTQFAISIYREKLLQAIDFRNQYSDRPYLPSSIIPPERKNIIFADISKAKWPTSLGENGAARFHHGAVTISSLDGHASLTLPVLQQEFTVEFLCKVSQKLSAPPLDKKCGESIQDRCGRSGQNSAGKPSSQQLRAEEGEGDFGRSVAQNMQDSNSGSVQKFEESPWSFQNCSSEYCWVSQRLSVSSCAEEWRYPLSLALRFYQLHAGKETEPDEGNTDVEIAELNISHSSKAVTCLPWALPLSCQAPYLHRWDFSDFLQLGKEDSGQYLYSQPVKIVWSKGIIYRFLLGARHIEIYPGDGSVFKSEGSFLGKYFTRYYIQEGTREREETMYSASSLPPDVPGSLYSVWTIITQAVRVLQHNLERMLSLTHNYSVCCWKMACPEKGRGQMLPIPLAETIVPNVGRLLAYSDNKVHAVFYDGMILNMVWDFTSQDGKSQGPQDANTGWCKLTSPAGAQQLIHLDHPGLYERYVTTVVKWCRSLNKDGEMCAGTPQPIPEETWSVAAELEKIRRFNFLVENSNIPNTVSAAKRNPSSSTDQQNRTEEIFLVENVSKKNIAETLEKTSKVISDIDSLLASSVKRNEVKSNSGNSVPH